MKHRITIACTLVGLHLAPMAIADPVADAAALYDALSLDRTIAVMREEGLAYGEELGAEMLPAGATAEWAQVVSDIYDVDRMAETVRANFAAEIADDDLGQMLAFFDTARGAAIIDMEIDAPEAMLDESVDEASRDAAALAKMDQTPRFQALEQFVEANDLIESNVVGALNSSYAFYLGLIDGGAMPAGVTTETALSDVWSQEAEIRDSTTEWIYAFLLLAYEDLADEDLAAYTDFSRSEAGQDLNEALFVAFDRMFDDISRALGLASARYMVSQEL